MSERETIPKYPMEDIYFYLHPEDLEVIKGLDGLQGYDFRWPSLNWIWSTYYRLKQRGVENIHLVGEIPDKGIVIAVNHQLRLFQKFKHAFVISAVADSPPRFYTHMNISQNPFQHLDYSSLFEFPVWRHIAHWPQPNIIKRNPDRGDVFVNVAYFGDRSQLAAELFDDSFEADLNKMGLRFLFIEQDFNDYSNVDVVIAVRSFSKERFLYKPYSKLVNAWIAGVPIVVGRESSFQSIKKTELDFIAVESKTALLKALDLLRSDLLLRRKMVANGLERASEFSEDIIIEQWKKILFCDAQLYYKKWMKKSRIEKEFFLIERYLSRGVRSLKNRLKKNKS